MQSASIIEAEPSDDFIRRGAMALDAPDAAGSSSSPWPRLRLISGSGDAAHAAFDSVAAELATIVFRLGCSYWQRLDSLLSGMGIVTATPLGFGSLDAIVA